MIGIKAAAASLSRQTSEDGGDCSQPDAVIDTGRDLTTITLMSPHYKIDRQIETSSTMGCPNREVSKRQGVHRPWVAFGGFGVFGSGDGRLC